MGVWARAEANARSPRNDHADPQRCHQGEGHSRAGEGESAQRRPAHLRAGRRLLGLPVRHGARRDRRGRRDHRGRGREGHRRPDEPALPRGRRGRLQGRPDGRRLRHQEPERQVHLRLRPLVPGRRGRRTAARAVRPRREPEVQIVPLFPLPNVVLFPDVPLPLHVFEPRYRALVRTRSARTARSASHCSSRATRPTTTAARRSTRSAASARSSRRSGSTTAASTSCCRGGSGSGWSRSRTAGPYRLRGRGAARASRPRATTAASASSAARCSSAAPRGWEAPSVVVQGVDLALASSSTGCARSSTCRRREARPARLRVGRVARRAPARAALEYHRLEKTAGQRQPN